MDQTIQTADNRCTQDMDQDPVGGWGRRRRRQSKNLSPVMFDLMNELTNEAASFIREFTKHEPRMREIVGEFKRTADEVNKLYRGTNKARITGAFVGGTGIMLCAAEAIAGPFTRELWAPVAVGKTGIATVAAAGRIVSVTPKTKHLKEKDLTEKVEELGKRFMEIVEPLKENLEGIKRTCETLEDTLVKTQTELLLGEVEEFEETLRGVTELKEKSEETVTEAALIQQMNNLPIFILAISTLTESPEQDKKLTDSIIKSTFQSWRLTDSFYWMRQKLEEFTDDRRSEVNLL